MALTLQMIQETLKNRDYNSLILPLEEVQENRLIVLCGDTDDGTPVVIQISLKEHKPEEADHSFYQLNCYCNLFKIQPSVVSDCSRLLHLINKGSDLPGFGLDETSGLIFYRSDLFVSNEQDTAIIESMLGMALFQIDLFVPFIKSVGSGEKTLHVALEELFKEKEGV